MANGPLPLVRVWRGDTLESVHHGALVAVEGGEVVLARGDLHRPVFYRSTSKPLQALVGITSGAADAFGLTAEEIALAAGSHSSLPGQVEVARSLLAKAGVPESALLCGGHLAFDPGEARRQRRLGTPAPPVASNCSGKHALMLATARHLGLPLDSYAHPDHPVQREIRRHVAHFAGIAPEEVRVAVDGCGAPTFAVPLLAMARSLQRFGAPDDVGDEDLAAAARRVGAAMLAHPSLVAGPGRFDTDLMTSASVPLVAKAGAEGVHGVAVPGRRFGMAVKADDGADRGYRIVVIEALLRFGFLTEEAAEGLRHRQAEVVVPSRAGLPVGRVEAALE